MRLARRGRTVAFVIHYTSRKAADEAYREYRRESRAGCLSFIVRFKKLQHVFSIVPDQSTPTMDWRRIVLAALSGAVAIRGLIALVHLFL